jgi:hypothetical protein
MKDSFKSREIVLHTFQKKIIVIESVHFLKYTSGFIANINSKGTNCKQIYIEVNDFEWFNVMSK